MEEKNLYTLEQSQQFTFYRIPKMLFTKRYAALSTDAKLLYGLLLDRMGLSLKYGWCDERGFVFIYYAQSEVMEQLSCGHDKAGKLFAELEKAELIERRKQGLCKPDKIYVGSIQSDIEKSDVRASVKQESGNRIPGCQEYGFPDGSDTERNETDLNEIHLSVPDRTDGMEETVKENLEYDILMERTKPGERENIDELLSIICDTLRTTKPTVCISGNEFPTEVVRSRFLKLRCEHIEYVIGRLCENTTKVNNIRAYLLAALYNAPATISNYYTTAVNHDLGRQSA